MPPLPSLGVSHPCLSVYFIFASNSLGFASIPPAEHHKPPPAIRLGGGVTQRRPRMTRSPYAPTHACLKDTKSKDRHARRSLWRAKRIKATGGPTQCINAVSETAYERRGFSAPLFLVCLSLSTTRHPQAIFVTVAITTPPPTHTHTHTHIHTNKQTHHAHARTHARTHALTHSPAPSFLCHAQKHTQSSEAQQPSRFLYDRTEPVYGKQATCLD